MPEDAISRESAREQIEKRLADAGISKSDQSVQKAIELSISVLEQRRRVELAELRQNLQELKLLLQKENYNTLRRMNIIFLLGAVGASSAFATLASGYKEFIEGLKRLFLNSNPYGSFGLIDQALAQNGPVVQQTSAQLTPVVLYGIYILFALAYVASFYYMFASKEEKDKSNAQEVFRNLTAFFIGTISGKIV